MPKNDRNQSSEDVLSKYDNNVKWNKMNAVYTDDGCKPKSFYFKYILTLDKNFYFL